MAIEPPIRISAEEVNALVHSYLLDSGLQHSAFILNAEAQIDLTGLHDQDVKRGQLVELLHKALLYSEVEAHWQPDSVTGACKAPFSILSEHHCSSDAGRLETAVAKQTRMTSQAETKSYQGSSTITKRKLSEATTAGTPMEKKARTENPMETTILNKATHQPPQGSIKRLHGHESEVFVCAWNPVQPRLLASGDRAAAVHIWDVPDMAEDPNTVPMAVAPIRGQFQTSAKQADLTALHWSPDGTLLAAASYDSVLRVLTDKGELYLSYPLHQHGPIFAARFSHSGKYLLTGSIDGIACVWNVAEKKLVTMYRCHLDACLDVDWIDDEMFVTCGADKLISIMRVGENKAVESLSGHTNEVNQVRYNVHSKQLASCSDDWSARVWDLASIEDYRSMTKSSLPSPSPEVKVLRGHKNNVSTVNWCPRTYPEENRLLATSGFDGTARIWDSSTGECLKVFSDHSTPVFSISFSQDGQFLATGGGDGNLHVYDMQTKEKVWTWESEPDRGKDKDKQSIFEIAWQQKGGLDLVALALESTEVCIIDATRISELRTARGLQHSEGLA